MKHLTLMAFGTSLWASPWAADTPIELKTNSDKISYSVGYQIGGDFKQQNVELNAQAVVQGIADSISGTEPLMTEQEMRSTLVEFKRKIVAVQREEAQQLKQKELGADKAFLAENAKQEGVIVRPSGLQYKVLKAGSGRSPGPSDTVIVHFRGTLINGNEFTSSDAGKPATFRLDEVVIPGWREALPLMQEGGHWQLFLPPELGFGERTPLHNRALIFDVELIAVGETEKTTAADTESNAGAGGGEEKTP
jgi:FKBP-type peptidyl-prolyl cis-trans isomerase FklB